MKSAKFQIELGRVLNAYNLVTQFNENQFTFVSVIARKRSVTDRQMDGHTDRQTQINISRKFASKKWGIINITCYIEALNFLVYFNLVFIIQFNLKTRDLKGKQELICIARQLIVR